jgi:serine/threonine protein kinase
MGRMKIDFEVGYQLLLLAGEAIAAAVKAGGGTFRPAAGGATPPGATAARAAIDCFGPPIVAKWSAWLNSQDRPDQEQALQQLASLEPAKAHAVASQVMNKVGSGVAEGEKRLAVEYLAAIPTTTRDVLAPDLDRSVSDSTRSTPSSERALLRLLPVNAPPFPSGSELPGTPYILERLLGSGGFGVVYKAVNRFEQNTAPRAIKFCLNTEMIATLHRERELLDRLMAAGAEVQWSDRVVKLYGHNLSAPLPFLVYEYVPGGNLAARLSAIRKQKGQTLRPAQVLGLVRRICEAVSFAHARGLVHRDIKPSNILVSGNMIKLADFGIGGAVSRFAASHSSVGAAAGDLTATEQRSLFRGAGTPLYMSPEQRYGEAPEPRHDVYSIGVMWYQFLVSDFTRELHAGWAEELAEEYDVPQKHIDLIGQCVGYLKSRPATAKELLGLLPSPTFPTAPPTKTDRIGQVHTLTGHEGRVNGVCFFRDSRRVLSGASDGTARVWDLESGRQLAVHQTPARGILCTALSADARWGLFGCDDRNAWLWDLSRGSEPRCLAGHVGAVYCAAFSPDGRRIVTGGSDGSVRIWHAGSGREVLRIEEDRRPITGAHFTPDGLFIVTCSESGAVRIWDAETGWEARELTAEGGWLLCAAISPDGRQIACGGKEGLTLWSLENGQPLGIFEGHDLPVMSVAFAPHGRWLFSGSSDKTLRLWDVQTRQTIHSFERTHAVRSVALSPDGRYAASSGDDRTVRLWSLPRFDR